MPKTAKSYENPLIPHARMRALYRALVEVRVLGEHQPRAQRVPKGLEACWVGTALDLKDGDLTSDRAAEYTKMLQAAYRRAGRTEDADRELKAYRELKAQNRQATSPH